MDTAMTQNGNHTVAQRSWASAPVDVYENANEYLVYADIPGVKREDVSIEFADGELRLQANEYRRTFTVGRDVDADEIEAQLDKGVLQVRLPKLESAKPRKISIRTP
jgi:HSP20 family protein